MAFSGFQDLNPDFASALQQMMAAYSGGSISPFSGYRTPEHQAQLFKEAVIKYGSEGAARKWVAPPGRSQHNMRGAVDLKYSDDAARAWAHANAARFGLVFPMKHEPWHIELAGGRGDTAHYDHSTPPGESGPVLGLSDMLADATTPSLDPISNIGLPQASKTYADSTAPALGIRETQSAPLAMLETQPVSASLGSPGIPGTPGKRPGVQTGDLALADLFQLKDIGQAAARLPRRF